MNYKMTPAQVQSAIREKLSHIYGVSAKNASDDEFYKASALVVRDLLVRGRDEFVHEAEKQETKQIYYLCMEFLLGRSLKNNLFNLGLEDSFRKALSEMGVKLDNLYEQEPDAGLGNGGLGRLDACCLDGLATQGYPAMGYSLRYEYGIFRQKLVEGWQTELPDFWLPGGEVWMQKVDESAIEVHFDGYIEEQWHDHYHSVRHKNYNPVMAIPYRHLYTHSSLDDLPKLAAIHLNDTHPVLAIPELMRIMLDECGYEWDAAWDIVTRTIAYTNHTVMSEALECWSADLFKSRLPRIYQIVEEINRRFWIEMRAKGVDEGKIWRMAPLNDGYVRMANLAVYATHSTNGVSALHSEILKDSVFHDFYTEWPNKFKNVTNGIAHRRWLNQSNPELASLITELTGDGFIHDAAQLEKLMKYKDDTSVQKKLAEIKLHNKQRLAEHVKRTQGQIVDPNSIFDVQVKRLHEYKRQHMNALHILSVYQWLLENPNADYTPHTFFFGAKAAPGYYFAKEILQFIVCLADTINNDPRVNQKLRVIFVENYCVSWAELLTPAAEISEQISLAGTEASGTSNMKFMINGAITLGTLDGANVEIHDAVGDDNIILFGMTTPEVNSLRASGYNPRNQYEHNDIIRKAIDALGQGFNGKTFQNLHQALLNVDQYMALADFASYSHAQQKAEQLYKDQTKWNSMSLVNTAKAGIFAADRAIRDYANTIWLAKPVETKAETKKK